MAAKKDDAGQAEVQKTTDTAEDKGYTGEEVDPTPNQHYAVDGVTSGKPVPETDPKAAAEAEKALGKRGEE